MSTRQGRPPPRARSGAAGRRPRPAPALPALLLLLLAVLLAAAPRRAAAGLPRTSRAYCLSEMPECTTCAWRLRGGEIKLLCLRCSPGYAPSADNAQCGERPRGRAGGRPGRARGRRGRRGRACWLRAALGLPPRVRRPGRTRAQHTPLAARAAQRRPGSSRGALSARTSQTPQCASASPAALTTSAPAASTARARRASRARARAASIPATAGHAVRRGCPFLRSPVPPRPASSAPAPPGRSARAAAPPSTPAAVLLPGHGWTATTYGAGAASPCPRGSFNPARGLRPPAEQPPANMPNGCRPCQGSLTTPSIGSDNEADCAAPAGHYYHLGRAVSCDRGTYKSAGARRARTRAWRARPAFAHRPACSERGRAGGGGGRGKGPAHLSARSRALPARAQCRTATASCARRGSRRGRRARWTTQPAQVRAPALRAPRRRRVRGRARAPAPALRPTPRPRAETPPRAARRAPRAAVTVPGYGINVTAGANGTQIVGRFCGNFGYAPGGAAFDMSAPAPAPCRACPAGTETLDEGADSEAKCLAPPGWGFNETTNSAARCPTGWCAARRGARVRTECHQALAAQPQRAQPAHTQRLRAPRFKTGFNRATCTQCGEGITTDGEGAPCAGRRLLCACSRNRAPSRLARTAHAAPTSSPHPTPARLRARRQPLSVRVHHPRRLGRNRGPWALALLALPR